MSSPEEPAPPTPISNLSSPSRRHRQAVREDVRPAPHCATATDRCIIEAVHSCDKNSRVREDSRYKICIGSLEVDIDIVKLQIDDRCVRAHTGNQDLANRGSNTFLTASIVLGLLFPIPTKFQVELEGRIQRNSQKPSLSWLPRKTRVFQN